MIGRSGLVLLLAVNAFGQDVLSGYRQQGMKYEGPGEWRQAVEPIWVYEYHTIRLRYRASGLGGSNAPVLTIRPGWVRPPTPETVATGYPVVVAAARDLTADGEEHTFEVDLRGKMRTGQVDELVFSLPAGARLDVMDLDFRGDRSAVPCEAGGPALPGGVRKLAVTGPLDCGGFAATGMRGLETIRIEGGGGTGGTLYLSLMAHTAGLTRYSAGGPVEPFRIHETSETAAVIARIHYTDGSEEEQFPLHVAGRRHMLLNRRPALYALALESRPMAAVELLDRSPHVQLVVFAAGLGEGRSPEAAEPERLPPAPDRKKAAREMDIEGSRWFEIEPPSVDPRRGWNADGVRGDLRVERDGGTRVLKLAVTNTGPQQAEFTLVFPAVEARAAAGASDTYYVYPRLSALITNQDRVLEDPYSSYFPLQFMDAFAPSANQGACVIVRDNIGRLKRFRLAKRGASVRMEARYPVRLAPGETFRPPDVAVVPHAGDWREGFAAYQQWVATWHKPRGQRADWLASSFWMRRDYPFGGSGYLYDPQRDRYTFDELMREGELFGGIDFIDISGWGQSRTSGRVGDYPIELGGAADLKRNVAAAAAANVVTGLYFEGYLVEKKSAAGRRWADEWQMVDALGRRMGAREVWFCPTIPEWQRHLAGRMADVAVQTGAQAVYLDQHGYGNRRCFASTHGHEPGMGLVPGEIGMAREVRRALDRAGLTETIVYTECAPVDAAAPYYDGALSDPSRLFLWRFVFPGVRLWNMVSVGVEPRPLSAEEFRLSLWHGNGLWLKGRSETWYGEELLAFMRGARALLKKHAAAFSGTAEPLIESPHPAVWINRFQSDGDTVYTLFNASYRSARLVFEGRERTVGPRGVEVVAAAASR